MASLAEDISELMEHVQGVFSTHDLQRLNIQLYPNTDKPKGKIDLTLSIYHRLGRVHLTNPNGYFEYPVETTVVEEAVAKGVSELIFGFEKKLSDLRDAGVELENDISEQKQKIADATRLAPSTLDKIVHALDDADLEDTSVYGQL